MLILSILINTKTKTCSGETPTINFPEKPVTIDRSKGHRYSGKYRVIDVMG